MTNEEGDTDPLQELGASFSPGYIGNTICEVVEALQSDVNDRFRRITKLLTYMSGLYYSDRQRRMAEAEIFRLQTEIAELHTELVNTLTMAPELGRPVTITHT